MTLAPDRSVRLFGTEEPVAPPRILKAGPLTAELEAGNLRYIRFGGRELIRAISFLVRDRNWGTYAPRIENLAVTEDTGSFTVAYDATVGDDRQTLRYHATITGASDGTLRFHGRGEPVTDFVTNRAGFVVLHPLAGVAGHPARIEHVDGTVVEGSFPDIIDPVQPMMALRALRHQAGPGLFVTCRMEGDTFEMEDQRNWTDASYKTYVRPLALPWPYTLSPGTVLDQTVTLTVEGAAGESTAGAGPVTVALGDGAGAVPALGAGLDPDDADSAQAQAAVLAQAGLAHLVCHYDPRRGHGRATLMKQVAVAAAIGAEPWLEAVIAEVAEFAGEVAALGLMVAEMGSPFTTVLLSPAADLKSTLPGSVWPPAPPADALFRAGRRAFPNVRLGGGMFSYFTELNRKRPPVDLLDLVTFTTSGVVHAGDDRSVMEGLESLPYIARSVRSFADLPFNVGPSAIGMRANPYGAAPFANPGNIRQAMNHNDPRQRGLLGAAWTLGFVSQFAYGGADTVTLGGLTGPFGIVHTRAAWPTPGFTEDGTPCPVFHVLRGLAALRGAELRRLTISAPQQVLGVAAQTGSRVELWLANLTGQPVAVALPEALRRAPAFILDAQSLAASPAPGAADRLTPREAGAPLTLDAFAVARIASP